MQLETRVQTEIDVEKVLMELAEDEYEEMEKGGGQNRTAQRDESAITERFTMGIHRQQTVFERRHRTVFHRM